MSLIYSIMLWFVITVAINTYFMTFARPVFRYSSYPPQYVIPKRNRIDFQQHSECAAFSTAYVLRHFGDDTHGHTLYPTFRKKLKDGTIFPKGIRIVLKQKGLRTSYYRGNLHTLKAEVSKGVPVLVIIKYAPKSRHLHCVPVVGYDETHIFLADSLEELVTSNSSVCPYNRKVDNAEFKKLWQTNSFHMPIHRNTYIATRR